MARALRPAGGSRRLRKELLDYLARPHTHAPFEAAVKDFPAALMNKKVAGLPYTPWMLLEHIRITQHDMVDFMRSKNYREMEWPKDYWPSARRRADRRMWNSSVAAYEKDLAALRSIIRNPKNDLFAKIPWGSGQTILREAIQIIDHASYHIAELVLMRRALGIWK